MSDLLQKIPFTEELLAHVQGFDCGTDAWELPQAEWIKAGPDVKNGALYEMKHRKGLKVWLHANAGGDLVGYSSLVQSNWQWPTEDDPRVPISVIPNVAIQQRFWGLPHDPPKYSRQIIDHLIYEARQEPNRRTLLGLFVDPRNKRAIGLYQKTGFTEYFRTYFDDRIEYKSMLLKLGDMATR